MELIFRVKFTILILMPLQNFTVADKKNFCSSENRNYTMKNKILNLINCSNPDIDLENDRESVKHLIAKNNNFKVLEESWLEGAYELTKIDFDSCSIEKLSQNAFKDQKKLQDLDLRSNKLTNLCPGVFDKIISLQNLYLNQNRITIIHDHIWQYNKNLVFVDLRDNLLFAISANSIKSFNYKCKFEFQNNYYIKTFKFMDNENGLSDCYNNYEYY